MNFCLAKAAYNSAAYDTRQNAYAQQTYPTQPQYAPYQVSKFISKIIIILFISKNIVFL